MNRAEVQRCRVVNTTETTRAQGKLTRCLTLAHDCSRDSWDHDQSPAHRREYKRLRHEAMQDARYWRDEIRKNLEN